MTREELIKRLSYRGQFGQLIVDTVGLGPLIDEAIAMLKDDAKIINNIMEVLEYYQDKNDGIELAIKEIKGRFFCKRRNKMAKWMVISKHAELDQGSIIVEFFDDYNTMLGYLDMLEEYFTTETEVYERVHSNMDGHMEYRNVNLYNLVTKGGKK